MASIWIQTLTFQPTTRIVKSRRFQRHNNNIGINYGQWNIFRHSVLRAVDNSSSVESKNPTDEEENVGGNEKVGIITFKLNFPIGKFQQVFSALPALPASLIKKHSGTNFAIWLCVGMTILIISVRAHVARKDRNSRPGSVADLVRRGQLRSDRRGISSPLKYEDPFNNPMVKVGKQSSTVEMCGKVYRLAPVTLTNEEQAIHQKRRSRAYQWKRPTIFLKEGDPVPPDVDPDTVRWIPANHPFATTAVDIDEDLAQNNVHQKHGVPFRIRAEHEALQKKLEALQSGQQLNKLGIDAGNVKDFERPFKSNSMPYDSPEIPSNNKVSKSRPPQSDPACDSFGSNFDSEEAQKS